MLNVSHLTVNYGAIEAVRDLSFEVAAGQVVAIIGANGAGKSTTLNTIGGILKPRSGKIRFDGHDISAMRADQIARLGLAQVPEGREVLAPLTVEENLRLGAYVRADREAIESDLQAMFMRFPILEKRPTRRADERWRTANAGGGARADGASQTADARRTQHGACPAHRQPDF